MNVKKVLVTGGGGFLGKKICEQLQKRGYIVSSFSRSRYPELERTGVQCFQGDITKLHDVEKAIAGHDAVIHTAAAVGIWGPYQHFWQGNVIGVENVLKSLKKYEVRFLVHTSSPSVSIPPEGVTGADESIAYPSTFFAAYPETKKRGEELVVKASDGDQLRSVCLRPHHIWGQGDPHLMPRMIARAKQRQLKFVGDRTNLVDIIHVDNAACAHVDALEHLVQNSQLNGRCYFLGQERPVNLWEFVNQLIKVGGAPEVKGHVSYRMAFNIGTMLEVGYRAFGIYNHEPPMTRFLATVLAKSHYFNHTRAKRDFGYKPHVSIEEGLATLH